MVLKLATWDSSPGIRWGERLRTLLCGVPANPVGWGVKTPTNAQLPEAGRAGYSKEAKNVPLDGQASYISSGDACCLRDGAYKSVNEHGRLPASIDSLRSDGRVPSRKLVRVEGRSFEGWGCSECAWLFNPSGPPVGKSLDEMKQNFQMQLSEEFASHDCANFRQVKRAISDV
jgi:hypothetical protein